MTVGSRKRTVNHQTMQGFFFAEVFSSLEACVEIITADTSTDV